MASNFLNRQRVGGGGGGSLTPGSVTTTILANGAVTLPKIGAGTGTAGQVLARSTGNNSLVWVTPGLTNASVKAVHLDAGTATNDYVLTADSTETSGIEWKINAPAARTVNPSKIADITVVSGSAGKLLGISSSNHAEFALIDPFTVSDIGAGEITTTMLASGAVTLPKLAITGTPTDGQVIKYDADNTRLEWADDTGGGGSLGAGSINNSNMFASGVVDSSAIGDNAVGVSELASTLVFTVGGQPVSRMRNELTHEVNFGNYTYSASVPTSAGGISYASSTRTLSVYPKAGDSAGLRETLVIAQKVSVTKQAAGSPVSVVGVIESVSFANNIITAVLRDSDDTLTGTFAAGDTASLVTNGIFDNRIEAGSGGSITIPDGSITEAKMADDAASTRVIADGALRSNHLPTAAGDLRDIGSALGLLQPISDESLGSYDYVANAADVTVGKFTFTTFTLGQNINLTRLYINSENPANIDTFIASGSRIRLGTSTDFIEGDASSPSANPSGYPTGTRLISINNNDSTTTITGSLSSITGGTLQKFAEFKNIDDAEDNIADDAVDTDAIADSAVTLPKLAITGTPADGQVIKYDADNTRLEWANDNSSSGGGGVTLPLDLESASNFSGENPIVRGGTGASTAAAARANLGVAAAGGSTGDQGDLPVVTELDAQPEGHVGQYTGTSTNRPETGSGSGMVAKFDDDGQIAVDADEGTTWYRTHSTTVDNNWSAIGTPSPALTAVTDIAGMRAINNYQVVESTFAAGNPQQTPRCIIARFPGGFGGHGYLCAIPPGGLGFWVVELPSATFAATDISSLWQTWNDAPLPGGGEFENNYLHRGGAYDKVPAGQTGLVLDLQVASSTIADAFVNHTYTSSTTSSEYTANFYTSGNTVRESTRGHTHAIGTWAKTQIGNDQLEDGAVDADAIANSIIITESDGSPVVTAKVPQLEDVVLTGYTYTTNTTPAAGQVNYNSASRAFRGRARAGDESLLSELISSDFEFSLTKTSSGQAASVRGVFNVISPVVQGVFQGQFRSEDIVEVGDFTAGDTITLRGHKAVYTKLDRIAPVSITGSSGLSQANHLLKFSSTGSAITSGNLDVANMPTLLSDIQDINQRLRNEQQLQPRTFSNSYQYSASASAEGTFRYDDSGTLFQLTISPASGETAAVREYLSVPGVLVYIGRSDTLRIRGHVVAVVSNPSGAHDNAITVTLRDDPHVHLGDVRSLQHTLKTEGSFLKILDPVTQIADDAVGRDALNTSNTGSDGQVLSRTSTGLSWVNNAGGGSGDTFDEDAYSSKAFGVTVDTQYDRRSSTTSMPAGSLYWNTTTRQMTIVPRSTDTDLADFLTTGTVVDFRGASDTKLRGQITRVANPTGTFPSGTFTVQVDNTQNIYYKSSNFDAATTDLSIHALGKALSLVTEGAATVPGGFGVINLDWLDLTAQPTAGQVLGVSSTDLSSDRRIVPVSLPAAPRTPKYYINIQSSGDSLSIANTTMQALRDGTSAYSLRMQIVNAADWVELISDGVVNAGSGALQAVGIRLEWRFRTATSESGLASATYEPADSQRRTFGLGDIAYQTKQAGGGTGGTSHRDLWVLSNDWMSLSHISSVSNPTTAGRWIEFELRHALADNDFSGSAISNRYGYTLKMTCIPNTDMTDQS